MQNFIKVLIGLLFAFLFFTVFSKISPSLLLVFNVFSLVFIYFAMEKGEVFGSCLGAVCGLVHDYFSSGVLGVLGLAKTVSGYLAGYLSKKIDVQPFLRNFFFILILIGFELILWALLYSFIIGEKVSTKGSLLYFQPPATALLGSISFFTLRKVKKKDMY